jgi:hypothetical protein
MRRVMNVHVNPRLGLPSDAQRQTQSEDDPQDYFFNCSRFWGNCLGKHLFMVPERATIPAWGKTPSSFPGLEELQAKPARGDSEHKSLDRQSKRRPTPGNNPTTIPQNYFRKNLRFRRDLRGWHIGIHASERLRLSQMHETRPKSHPSHMLGTIIPTSLFAWRLQCFLA